MILPLTGLLVFGFILAAGQAPAQMQPPTGGAAVGTPATPPERVAASEEDREFAKQAVRDIEAEIQTATMATKRAESNEVRGFAERAVADYGKAREELERAVKLAQVEVPAGAGLPEENMVTRLDDEETGAFDLAYVTQSATQHKRMVELFKREAESGLSPPLRRFATETLPLVEKNGRALEDLQKQLVQKHQSQQPPKGK